MIFSTSLFLLYFLPLFLLSYHLTPTKYKNYTALLASLLFYIWGAPTFFLILLVSIIIDYYLTLKLTNEKSRKSFLVYSLILNIGLLAYFKYANFMVHNFNSFIQTLGIKPMSWIEIALPIGISFFTFQKISYAIDIYRKRSNPLQSIPDYALYILLFPQLIAGPIVRYNEISDQLVNRSENETFNNKLVGFYRFIIGLSKKVLIANNVGEYVDMVFSTSAGDLSVVSGWLGLLAYAIQIYFDFSGYSDMAIGLGKMIGFNFPENFNNPYLSKSITEFWRRWHITLSTWMRDYIYIPLGGNQKSKTRMYLNLWIVFLISGLWHGASWNFIIWGAIHGLFLMLDKLFLKNVLDKIGKLSFVFTFFIVLLSWGVFRGEDLTQSKQFFVSLFSFKSNAIAIEPLLRHKVVIIIGLFFSFFRLIPGSKIIEQFIFNNNAFTKSQHILFSVVAVMLLVVCIGYINSQSFNPFIYFRF